MIKGIRADLNFGFLPCIYDACLTLRVSHTTNATDRTSLDLRHLLLPVFKARVLPTIRHASRNFAPMAKGTIGETTVRRTAIYVSFVRQIGSIKSEL